MFGNERATPSTLKKQRHNLFLNCRFFLSVMRHKKEEEKESETTFIFKF